MGKIAEKGLYECIFDIMALYFECRINNEAFKRLP